MMDLFMASKNKFVSMAANLMSEPDLQLKMLELTCTLSGSQKAFILVSALQDLWAWPLDNFSQISKNYD